MIQVDSARHENQGHFLASKFQNFDTATKIKAADQSRLHGFYAAFDDYRKLIAMTGNLQKYEAILRLCQRLVASAETNVISQAPHLPEHTSTKVSDVATSKVVQVFGQADHVRAEHPVTQILAHRLGEFFNVNHFVGKEGFELIRQALPTGTVVIGADVNYFFRNEHTQVFEQNHRLDREGQLKDDEILKIWLEMKQQYCYPKSGKIEMAWDNAVVMMNGQVFNFHDRLRIKSGAIDPFLFDKFMNEALLNGLFYTANTHFGLLECLIANQQIETVAVLSDEETALGLTFADKAMRPVQSDYAVLLAAVKANRPPRLIQ